ncbi:DUF4157 domain-containing protein [Mucilaginibacter sp.]|uniref:eCIS core domain-containing protein n=1 Tax=Mucilaginibacter sp. TaxID=1882438 RepID=UPI00262AB8B7|nr:DUF4157 domain-containing protein [Mucilaginibacter sp.]MDB4918385.1 hypothetical protein [Mucilaginibacter sp.]
MSKHADKITQNEKISTAGNVIQQRKNKPALQFVAKSPKGIAQRKIQQSVNNSTRVQQFKTIQLMADNYTGPSVQRKKSGENEMLQERSKPVQKKANNTGLPDNLRSGIENLSGMNMNDVKVHYNSAQPAQMQAHAYAQGTDIHIAPGQEKHLPHEAWHIVQQKQGRVRPTTQMKGKLNINDDNGLEKEADVMGDKAMRTSI